MNKPNAAARSPLRRPLVLGLCLAALASAAWWGLKQTSQPVQPALIEGIFWQPDNATAHPHGNWHLLGAETLVVQWLMVDGKAWLQTDDLPAWEQQPDWQRIAREPWAKQIIAGLSGHYHEPTARREVHQLGAQSLTLSDTALPFQPAGYYFPVEADPSWLRVHRLKSTLERLPRPLWVSVYSGEHAPEQFDLWVKSWLPDDVGVFFQDGVGVGVREPEQARRLADQLVKRFGQARVAIVLEAFEPRADGNGFQPAGLWQLTRQLRAYCGLRVYIFDGPHYLRQWQVRLLALWARWGGMAACTEASGQR